MSLVGIGFFLRKFQELWPDLTRLGVKSTFDSFWILLKVKRRLDPQIIYIKRAGLVGVFHCALPALGWFVSMLFFVPFREVYIVRLALCLTVGCPIGAYLNRYSVDMWLLKHHSNSGPAKIYHGTLNGAAVGIGTALLPALTSLISSNHLEMAKTFIIVSYIASALVGGIIGTMVAAFGRKYLEVKGWTDIWLNPNVAKAGGL